MSAAPSYPLRGGPDSLACGVLPAWSWFRSGSTACTPFPAGKGVTPAARSSIYRMRPPRHAPNPFGRYFYPGSGACEQPGSGPIPTADRAVRMSCNRLSSRICSTIVRSSARKRSISARRPATSHRGIPARPTTQPRAGQRADRRRDGNTRTVDPPAAGRRPCRSAPARPAAPAGASCPGRRLHAGLLRRIVRAGAHAVEPVEFALHPPRAGGGTRHPADG